jgi:SAM-dependent methyltransferase
MPFVDRPPVSSACPVCDGRTVDAGTKEGGWSGRVFQLRHCPACGFSFVEEPWTDYAEIYGRDYYEGRGADPLVDYMTELLHPDRTIRLYEWRGITSVVESLLGPAQGKRWLDYGCGNGGLVRYCDRELGCDVVGFEEGWIRGEDSRRGIPVVGADDLDPMSGTFDVVTMIEVIEHIPDPVATLRRVRSLLRPGGLLFLTTGNAAPFRRNLARWRYVVPEVHVSFFEPATLALALTRAGFRPEFPGHVPGFTDIIRFKVLKNLRVRNQSRLEGSVPWAAVSRMVDRRFGVTAHPVGWAV